MMVALDIQTGPVAQGAINGLTYGALAIGLILTYRSSRIINFAHGALGTVAAAAFGMSVVEWDLPYWLLFPAALAVGALSGMLVEVVAVRRLRGAPPTMSIVATLGMGAFLIALGQAINTQISTGSLYPQPDGIPSFALGNLVMTPAYAVQLVGTPVLVVALALMLRYTRYGVAIRAAADNREAAVLSGVSPGRMSWMAWGAAGVLAAYAAILQFPSQGFVGIGHTSMGIGLLLRALLPAVIARMNNLPLAFGAGVVLGVAESVLLWNGYDGGQVELLVFAVMLLMLLLYSRQRFGREQEQGSWLAVQSWPPLPDALATLWGVRNLGRILAGGLVAALVGCYWVSNSVAATLTVVLAFSLIGMSVYVTSGLVGQLSLGQFAFAGLGAVFSYQLTSRGVDFAVAFLLAAVATGAASMALAFTSLRIRGLMLTATTLSLAVMFESWLFPQSWAFDTGTRTGRPIYFGHALTTGRDYYLFAIPVFLVGLWITTNIARSGLGRSFVALRDNEDAARAFAVPATRRKMQAMAAAGVLAGLGGALYGHAQFRVSATTFPADTGITVVAIAAIGGITIAAGSVLGALYIVGLPALVQLDAAGTAASTFGWLILVLYFPGGLAQLARPVRDRVVDLVARLHGVDPHPAAAEPEVVERVPVLVIPEAARAEQDHPGDGQRAMLSVREVSKHFAGVHALEQVSLDVYDGEILGLIGPNGAGKTTLFEIVGGFLRPTAGQVSYAGTDVTGWSPERRAAAGLVRSFQDARMFPTMTVLEVITLALRREQPANALGTALAWPPARRADRATTSRALELIDQMGLTRFTRTVVGALSTGTRRIVELTCVIAMSPRVILLDEPSAGLAQRESEALGQLIAAMRSSLHASVVVIEHDVPLIGSISDRVVAMHLGRPIASGTPTQVCAHPDVVASYLGDDPTSIARSGPLGAELGIGHGAGVRAGRPEPASPAG